MTNQVASFGQAEPQIDRAFGGALAAQAQLPIHNEGDHYEIEGTANISSLPPLPKGHIVSAIVTTGTPTLVHSAAALIVQGAANYTLAVGDRVSFVSMGDGLWRAFVSPAAGGPVGAAFSPPSNDGAALGTTALEWSDLFLASGGVVNWSNGDVTITHSSDLLAFAGAASGYTLDAKLVVGYTANLSIGGNADNLEVLGTTAATAGVSLGMFNATAGTAAHFDFYRSKNASIGSATVVASGDDLGDINWYGAQQTGTFATQTRAARIRAEVDGTVTSGGSGDMPGRIVLSTTADGGSDVTDRLILDSAGILKPNANDGVALGTGSLSFSDLFLASGAVVNFNNSDVTLTHSSALLTASSNLKSRAIYSGSASIADDAATSFTLGGVGQAIMLIMGNTSSVAHCAIVSVFPAGPTTGSLVSGASVNVTTGVLSGTTGTDVKMTVSCHTDGKVYIENRLGATVTFYWTLFTP